MGRENRNDKSNGLIFNFHNVILKSRYYNVVVQNLSNILKSICNESAFRMIYRVKGGDAYGGHGENLSGARTDSI